MKNYLYTALFVIAGLVTSFVVKPGGEAARYTPPAAANVMSRPVNTVFQPSDQRTTIACYNVTITASATLILGSQGQIVLEQSADGVTGWSTVQTASFGINSGLLITAPATVSVFGVITRGYYCRIRTVSVIGTPTFGTPSGTEIQIN